MLWKILTTWSNELNRSAQKLYTKSHYADDTAFTLLSSGEVIAASKLIVSHFDKFWSDYSHWK
jgi:hypothetical protein